MIVNKTSWGFVLSGAQQLFEDVKEITIFKWIYTPNDY